jgi:hypothetical protein
MDIDEDPDLAIAEGSKPLDIYSSGILILESNSSSQATPKSFLSSSHANPNHNQKTFFNPDQRGSQPVHFSPALNQMIPSNLNQFPGATNIPRSPESFTIGNNSQTKSSNQAVMPGQVNKSPNPMNPPSIFLGKQGAGPVESQLGKNIIPNPSSSQIIQPPSSLKNSTLSVNLPTPPESIGKPSISINDSVDLQEIKMSHHQNVIPGNFNPAPQFNPSFNSTNVNNPGFTMNQQLGGRNSNRNNYFNPLPNEPHGSIRLGSNQKIPESPVVHAPNPFGSKPKETFHESQKKNTESLNPIPDHKSSSITSDTSKPPMIPKVKIDIPDSQVTSNPKPVLQQSKFNPPDAQLKTDLFLQQSKFNPPDPQLKTDPVLQQSKFNPPDPQLKTDPVIQQSKFNSPNPQIPTAPVFHQAKINYPAPLISESPGPIKAKTSEKSDSINQSDKKVESQRLSSNLNFKAKNIGPIPGNLPSNIIKYNPNQILTVLENIQNNLKSILNFNFVITQYEPLHSNLIRLQQCGLPEAQKMINFIENKLTCACCGQKNIEDLTELRCGDIVCRTCLEDEARNTQGTLDFKCPECKIFLDSLQEAKVWNFLGWKKSDLENFNLNEKLIGQGYLKCKICEKNKKVYYNHCLHLCKECSASKMRFDYLPCSLCYNDELVDEVLQEVFQCQNCELNSYFIGDYGKFIDNEKYLLCAQCVFDFYYSENHEKFGIKITKLEKVEISNHFFALCIDCLKEFHFPTLHQLKCGHSICLNHGNTEFCRICQ